MKKILFILPAVFLYSYLFASPLSQTSLAGEMQSAYSSRFYPGVIKYADEILSSSSASVFAGKAYIYKGESLFMMGRTEEALEVLAAGETFVKDSPELNAARLFWTGRGLYSLDKTDSALLYFYRAAEILKKERKTDDKNYSQSLYYSGKANRRLENYPQAVSCLEYCVQNGKKFSKTEFEDAGVNLCESAVLCKNYEKAEYWCAQLKNASLSSSARYRLLLCEGQALEGLKKYRSAYEKYAVVIEEGPVSLSSSALQRAYTVSSEHPSEVKEDAGSLILKAQGLSKERPQLVSEFWTRLAVDSFKQKDYSRSLEYLKNAEKGADLPLKQLGLIYKTEIQFITSKKIPVLAAQDALKSLEENWGKCGFNENTAYTSQALSLKARYYAVAEDWDKSLETALPLLSSDDSSVRKNCVYWAALAYYSKGEWAKASELLNKNQYTDDDFMLLKAKALAKEGKSSQADRIFYDLSQKGSLSNDGRLDYTRTLLNAGHLITTVEQADRAKGAEAAYMKGLALFNRKEWKKAEECFVKAQTEKDLDSNYVNLSRFYAGYCQYQLAEYSKAYSNLYTFINLESSSPLVWNGCVTAARCAVQDGKFNEASAMAQKAVSFARSEKQKQESIILNAGIYTDSRKYDQALSILQPYASEKTEFGWQCSFLCAQIYVQKKDYESADRIYEKLSAQKTSPAAAEEALFRRGELAWTNEKYERSVSLFEEYTKKYYQGQFYDAAMYFAAEALVKTGRKEKAVLYYQQVVDSSKGSTYRYGSEKQLVALYKEKGDYASALLMAQKMTEEYGEQASKDGIPLTVKELKALSSGADSKILKKQLEWENAGGNTTQAGRKAGTELAELYALAPESYSKAENLASSLLGIQRTKEEESLYAARNAKLLAEIYRKQKKNSRSAEMYLTASELFRKSGDDSNAPRSLYGAAEAFDAAGMKADSESVAQTLIKLYPDSSYAKDVRKLIK